MDTPAARRRPLPIGIQSFAKLREGGCYYVDKTGLAIDLIESGSYFFLSRPRRFGKSLLVDTFKELFEGNRTLFDGLAAETRWDWSKRYPVIHLSFANSTAAHPEALRQEIRALLDQHGARLGVFGHDHDQDTDRSISSRFATLIAQAHRQHGRRVVVLVDGYTQPAAARLDDPVQAQAMCDVLMDLYSVFKGSDEHLEFVLLVGMGRFRPPGLRSDLNQTLNLTQDPRWSGLCGFTDEELETVFAPEMAGIDSAALHRWHGGYQWGKDGVRVVHPVDALRVFADRKVEHHRTEPDAITALVSRMLAAERCFTPDLDAWHTGYMSLSVFEIDRIPAGTLLFHTGHLSMRSVRRSEYHEFITLGYPNLDIQISLNRSLLSAYGVPLRTALDARLALLDALKAARLPAVAASLQTLFAGIPSHWYATHPLGEFDGHGASVFYSHLAALGLDLRVEDATNHGRIDLTLTFGGQVFLFEFKVVDDQPDGSALAQIRAKGYADKYRDTGRTVHLVGIEFSRAARNVVGFEVETILP